MRDNRSLDNIKVEIIDDGLFQLGNTINNIPEYKYYGEKTRILKITEKHLTDSLDDFLNMVINFIPEYNNNKILTQISGPIEYLILDNKEYYIYNKEYTVFTSNTINFPERGNYKLDRQTQVSLGGYTLTGDPIVSGGSKGLIITESFISSNEYLIQNNIVQGSIEIDNNNIKYLITSVSKTDKKIINGRVYYNISITKQEL